MSECLDDCSEGDTDELESEDEIDCLDRHFYYGGYKSSLVGLSAKELKGQLMEIYHDMYDGDEDDDEDDEGEDGDEDDEEPAFAGARAAGGRAAGARAAGASRTGAGAASAVHDESEEAEGDDDDDDDDDDDEEELAAAVEWSGFLENFCEPEADEDGPVGQLNEEFYQGDDD